MAPPASASKIAVLGNGTIAVECCKFLLDSGERIAFIVGDYKDDGHEGWQKSLKKFAEEHKITFHQPDKVNTQEWYDFFKREAPDYLLSFQYRFIIKRPIIESAKKVAANLHFAPLPRYRGMYPIAWALLNGEKEFGVTLHVIDPGVDSGDIISQRMFPIEDGDTAKTLYRKAVENGISLFKSSWKSLQEMNFERKKQDAAKALYYPMGSIDFAKTRVDWNQTSAKVFDFCRAFIFVPFQLPTTALNGEELKIARVRSFPNADVLGKRPGEILEVSEMGAMVACKSGVVLVSLTDKVVDEMPPQHSFMEKRGVRKGAILQ